MKGDAKYFLVKWNAHFGGAKKNNACITDNNDPEVVAHEFAKYFESYYCDSSSNTSLKESFYSAYDVLIAKPENCFVRNFTLSEIKSAISKLKKD